MKIVQLSVYWRNDKDDGLALTFGPAGFTPDELTEMFAGKVVKDYFCASDEQLGTAIVETYFAQLAAAAKEARGEPLSMQKALLVALNILWLTDRGFLANDEFNGVLAVHGR